MTTPHKEITSGLKFPEGPVAMPDGSVILVEIARQTLTRVMPDGKQHVIATLGGGPNGAAMGPKGKIYVTNNGGFNWIERPGGRLFPGTVSADYKGGSIQRIDLKKVFVDGDDVCVLYEMVTNTPAGTAFIAEWYQVKGGKIAALRAVFDARPFAALFGR